MRCPSLSELPVPPPGKHGWPWTEATPEGAPSKPWPLISIVTPSYNQAAFIEETIRSVLLQGYPSLEYIIIDAGSTDGSVEIIRKYEKWITYWVSEKDSGQSEAINKGFRRATGVLCGWLNSDDILKNGTLAKVARADADFLAGDGEFFDGEKAADRKNVDEYSLEGLLEYYNSKYLMQPSVFFKRELFERVGGVNESLHYCMDLDLWIRMRKERPLHHVPDSLALLRQHSDCKTLKDNPKARQEIADVLRKHSRSLSWLRRLKTEVGCAKLCSSPEIVRAERLFLDGDRSGALKALMQTAKQYPWVVLSRLFIAACGRLAFRSPGQER